MQLIGDRPRFDWRRVVTAGVLPAIAGFVLVFMPGVHTVVAAASVLVVSAMSAGLEVAAQVGPKSMQRHPLTTRVVFLTVVLVALAVWITFTEL